MTGLKENIALFITRSNIPFIFKSHTTVGYCFNRERK